VGGLAGYGGGWPATIWHDFFAQEFNNVPLTQWPTPPTTYGSTWNLIGQLPPVQHHHGQQPGSGGGGGGHHCHGFLPFFCHHGGGSSPTPNPSTSPSGNPTPTPSGPPTRPPFSPLRGSNVPAMGAVAAPLLIMLVMGAFPAADSWRRRRRRRSH
jgi:hypothetical protein